MDIDKENKLAQEFAKISLEDKPAPSKKQNWIHLLQGIVLALLTTPVFSEPDNGGGKRATW